METIEGSFIIEVNNQPISVAEKSGEPQIHASLGPNPAIFTLVDGRLESGGWVLGRYLVEDRSLLPKRVFWVDKQHAKQDLIQKTLAVPDGDSYVLEFAGAPLIAHEGLLFADLMKSESQQVKLVLQ